VRLLLSYNNKSGDSIKVVYKNIKDKIYIESSRDTFFVRPNENYTDLIDFYEPGEDENCYIDSAYIYEHSLYDSVEIEVYANNVKIDSFYTAPLFLLDIPTHIPCYEKTIVTDTIIIE